MGRIASFIAACTMASVAWAADPDPCRLLTAPEIGAALGGAATGEKRGGPDLDPESKARTWSCDHRVGKLFVSVNVAEFASTAAARADLAEMMKLVKDTPESVPLADAPGLGERSVWGANKEGAMWVVQKGRYLLNVTVARELDNPAALREPLRKLTASGVGRL